MKQPTSSQSDYEANTTLTETENEPLHFTDWLGCGSVITPVLCSGISPAQTRAHYTYTRTSILIRAQSLRDSHMHKLSNNLAFVTCMSKWRTIISHTLPIPRSASSRHSHAISAHSGAWHVPCYADAVR